MLTVLDQTNEVRVFPHHTVSFFFVYLQFVFLSRFCQQDDKKMKKIRLESDSCGYKYMSSALDLHCTFIVITLLCHSNLGVLSKNHWKLIVIDNAMLCALLGGCHSTLDALKCL